MCHKLLFPTVALKKKRILRAVAPPRPTEPRRVAESEGQTAIYRGTKYFTDSVSDAHEVNYPQVKEYSICDKLKARVPDATRQAVWCGPRAMSMQQSFFKVFVITQQ